MRRLTTGLAIVAIASILTATACAPAPVRVALDERGRIVEDGHVAVVGVRARCAVGLEVLEAFVTLSQEGVSSDMAFFPLTCDGKGHKFLVGVGTFDDTRFTPGNAQGSAYVLTQDPDTGETQQAQDSGVVVLR